MKKIKRIAKRMVRWFTYIGIGAIVVAVVAILASELYCLVKMAIEKPRVVLGAVGVICTATGFVILCVCVIKWAFKEAQ